MGERGEGMDRFEACVRLRRLLSDELLRKLINKLLDSETARIEPVFFPHEGFRYKKAEETMELDADTTRKLLKELHQVGILKKILFDKNNILKRRFLLRASFETSACTSECLALIVG